MTPYLAQGAAMGIEDSAILGGLFEKYPTKETIPHVLQAYEKLRIKRAAKVASASIESRYFTQMPDGEKQAERDAYLLSHPGIWKGHKNIRSQKEFLDELFGYDAFAELDKYFAQQEGEKQNGVENNGVKRSALEQITLTA
jgi:salicylate hydroxylase